MKKYLIIIIFVAFSLKAYPQHISELLENYEENPFSTEGIEAAHKAKEIHFLSLEQEVSKLYEEAYAEEEFDKEKALEMYNKILKLLNPENNLYQKIKDRIKGLVE